MNGNGDDRARLVHETRKTVKRMRALARLLQRELDEREFQAIDESLREAGRRLSGARDAKVRVATLRELRERHPHALAGEQIDALAARLERAAAADEPRTGKPSLLADVGRMRGKLLRWSSLQHDPEALAEGLRLIYRDGRRRYKQAARSEGRDPERMHDWRKRVKRLYYALDMLGGKRVPATAELTRRADRLGDLLGLAHDLWTLTGWLTEDEQLDDAARGQLLELIERRRSWLSKQALALGASVYRRKPKRFASRTGRSLAR